MNLQEWKDSGVPRSDFYLTAGLALLITFMSWYTIEQSRTHQALRKRIKGNQKTFADDTVNTRRSTYTFGERVYILSWLIRHHHWLWAVRSGAWWRILSNDSSDLCGKDFMPEVCEIPEDLKNLPIAEYVIGVIPKLEIPELILFEPFPNNRRQAAEKGSDGASSA